MTDIQTTTDYIRNWAIHRRLDDADPNKQMHKLSEEHGELSSAFVRKQTPETKDAIGDMYVVLTILAMQLGTSIEECAGLAYEEIKDRTGKLVNGTFIKDADL